MNEMLRDPGIGIVLRVVKREDLKRKTEVIKITKWEDGRLVTSKYEPSKLPAKHRREPQPPDEATVVGIINYLKLAESDGQRYGEVLDEFMTTQPAATMKQVAAKRMSCSPPRTKIEAKKLLIKAYNLSALSPK